MTRKKLPLILSIPLLLVGVLLLAAVLLLSTYIVLINQSNGKIVVNGEDRSYILYVPKNLDPVKPAPLIISIHGFADWPANQVETTQWNKMADQYGFIVVYPRGTGFPLHWRATSPASAVNDIAFINALIDKLENEHNIDPKRIYADGFSNGGGMTFVLSCELSDRIAAIAGMSGAYLYPWESCQPDRPVPLIAFHGTADPIVPFMGGPSSSFELPFSAIPEWVDLYALHNGCSVDTESLTSTGQVSGIRYPGCSENAEVIFYTITNGGHSWPGSRPLPGFIVGTTNQEVNATRLIWQFFEEHPLQ